MAQQQQINIGDRLLLKAEFRNEQGDLTDPTTITCQIKAPTGSPTTYSYPSDITRESLGVYALRFIVAQSGKHIFRYSSTGTPTLTDYKDFYVSPNPF